MTRILMKLGNFLKEFCPGKEVGLGECWNYSWHSRMYNSIHSKSRNNSNGIAQGSVLGPLCNLLSLLSGLNASSYPITLYPSFKMQNNGMCKVSIPTGNSKQFCKPVKLLNGKRTSTIPVISHDGVRIVCDEQKANILNHFFYSYEQNVSTLQCKINVLMFFIPGKLTTSEILCAVATHA